MGVLQFDVRAQTKGSRQKFEHKENFTRLFLTTPFNDRPSQTRACVLL